MGSYFIFRSFPLSQDVRLYKNCTKLLLAVVSEAYHLIRNIAKELVVCCNADEEVF